MERMYVSVILANKLTKMIANKLRKLQMKKYTRLFVFACLTISYCFGMDRGQNCENILATPLEKEGDEQVDTREVLADKKRKAERVINDTRFFFLNGAGQAAKHKPRCVDESFLQEFALIDEEIGKNAIQKRIAQAEHEQRIANLKSNFMKAYISHVFKIDSCFIDRDQQDIINEIALRMTQLESQHNFKFSDDEKQIIFNRIQVICSSRFRLISD